ncbi:ABC-type xenobiotic transporter [Ranunculus cassubicifolius]
MAEEKGFDDNTNNNHASASTSNSPIEATTNGSLGDKVDKKGSEKSKEEEKSVKTVPYHKLFSFADSKDVLLMVVGTIGAVANCVSMPVMTLLIGELTDAFGQNANNSDTLRVVSKVSLKFVYLAIAAGIASFFRK